MTEQEPIPVPVNNITGYTVNRAAGDVTTVTITCVAKSSEDLEGLIWKLNSAHRAHAEAMRNRPIYREFEAE